MPSLNAGTRRGSVGATRRSPRRSALGSGLGDGRSERALGSGRSATDSGRQRPGHPDRTRAGGPTPAKSTVPRPHQQRLVRYIKPLFAPSAGNTATSRHAGAAPRSTGEHSPCQFPNVDDNGPTTMTHPVRSASQAPPRPTSPTTLPAGSFSRTNGEARLDPPRTPKQQRGTAGGGVALLQPHSLQIGSHSPQERTGSVSSFT